MFRSVLAAMAVVAALCISGQAAAEAKLAAGSVRMVMERTVEDFILPGYRAFGQAAGGLVGATKALCAAPGSSSLSDAQRAFDNVALKWATVEMVRFGPVMSENRLERILFWPDRKGTGLKQAQAALAKSDPSVLDAANMSAKSVAVQGLGALEFLLFGTGSQALETGDAFRCGYASAIAENIHAISGQLVAGWQNRDGALAKWTDQTSTEDVLESLNELVGTLVHGLENVRDQRLLAFLAPDGKDKPRLALFWRSGQTLPVLHANVTGLARLFDESAMDALLPEEEASIADSIRFEFAEAATLLDSTVPVAKALEGAEARARLAAGDVVLRSLLDRLDRQYAPATGLSSGFSFADGD